MMKDAVEDCQKLNIGELKEKFTGLANMNAFVSYSVKYVVNGNELRDNISLTKTPCFFGGFRWWFSCPGCSRRVGILYRPWYAKLLRCRHCYDLTYRQRQIHRNWIEFYWKHFSTTKRLRKILKRVGQKGFSKLEATQYLKAEEKLLQISRSIEKLDL